MVFLYVFKPVHLKEIVHPKMKILPVITYPHDVPTTQDINDFFNEI